MKKFAPAKSCSIRERRSNASFWGARAPRPLVMAPSPSRTFFAATVALKDCFCGAQKPAGGAPALPRLTVTELIIGGQKGVGPTK